MISQRLGAADFKKKTPATGLPPGQISMWKSVRAIWRLRVRADIARAIATHRMFPISCAFNAEAGQDRPQVKATSAVIDGARRHSLVSARLQVRAAD
jgi:hypothetical protein